MKIFKLAFNLIRANYHQNVRKILDEKKDEQQFLKLLSAFQKKIQRKTKRKISKAQAYKIARNLVFEQLQKSLKK